MNPKFSWLSWLFALVVIGTALSIDNDNEINNNFWVHDFPARAAAGTDASDFESELLDFVQKMLRPSQPTWEAWRERLARYDLTPPPGVHLVASVPGRHQGAEYGSRALSRHLTAELTLKRRQATAAGVDPPPWVKRVEFASSSIGKVRRPARRRPTRMLAVPAPAGARTLPTCAWPPCAAAARSRRLAAHLPSDAHRRRRQQAGARSARVAVARYHARQHARRQGRGVVGRRVWLPDRARRAVGWPQERRGMDGAAQLLASREPSRARRLPQRVIRPPPRAPCACAPSLPFRLAPLSHAPLPCSLSIHRALPSLYPRVRVVRSPPSVSLAAPRHLPVHGNHLRGSSPPLCACPSLPASLLVGALVARPAQDPRRRLRAVEP